MLILAETIVVWFFMGIQLKFYFVSSILESLLCEVHTSTHCEAPVHLSDRRYERRLGSGLRHGTRSMQRLLYALLSLIIALLGVLLVAVPRFFLPPPVPVGLLAQNIHRLIFFSF